MVCARTDNANLADEFRPLFFERLNVLGAKSLDIVPMDARQPLLGGDFQGPLG
jgi:hypothetical protein